MLTLLSPAKKLLSFSKPYVLDTSVPAFTENTKQLVQLMKKKTVEEIASLMDLSSDLAQLNYQRYQNLTLDGNLNNSYPALFLFQGDVYQGLKATDWKEDEIEFSQNHLAILSGLYGLLKPLDRIQPYRLEMGVSLANPMGSNLYEFWSGPITEEINNILSAQKNPILINLASSEYFKVVDSKSLNYPIVTINFYENKNNQVKMIGIYAKKARGAMARYIMQNKLDCIESLKQFSELGYHFNPETSNENQLDFIRVH